MNCCSLHYNLSWMVTKKINNANCSYTVLPMFSGVSYFLLPQVRDKEEELEMMMQKVDTLRHDIRKAEKLRREMESRIEDALGEASKERKLRERSEEYCRQMQLESDRLRVRGDVGPAEQQDTQRLKAELEKLEVTGF